MNVITTIEIFTTETIAASGSAESKIIDLIHYAPDGFFALQIILTGDGIAKFEYEISLDGTNFETKTGEVIVSGFTATSGTGSDGITVLSFEPPPCRFIKIKCTETGTTNSIIVTGLLLIQ